MRGYVRVFLLFRRPSSQQCPAKGDGGYWLVRVLPCQRGRGLLARIHPPPSKRDSPFWQYSNARPNIHAASRPRPKATTGSPGTYRPPAGEQSTRFVTSRARIPQPKAAS